MKERPILFSAPMVRAILSGTKTQTRRIAKKPVRHPDLGNLYAPGALVLERQPQHVIGRCCPYGQPGNRLWVRETHAPQADCWGAFERLLKGEHVRQEELTLYYAADYSWDERPFIDKWRPSIHMPRRTDGSRRLRGTVVVDQRRRQLGRESVGMVRLFPEDQVMPWPKSPPKFQRLAQLNAEIAALLAEDSEGGVE